MIIVTGERHAGKTKLILQTVAQAQARGLQVAGIACPGLWEKEQRAGFDLLELDTGDRYPLSRRVQGLCPIPYMFDADALERGKEALSPPRCRNADLVVVDEVGPLEIRGEGWADSLPALLSLQGPEQIWVVRRSLVQKVQEHFGFWAEVVDTNNTHKLEQMMAR